MRVRRNEVAHHIGRKDDAVEHRPRKGGSTAKREDDEQAAEDFPRERREKRQKRRAHEEKCREHRKEESDAIGARPLQKPARERHVENDRPPERGKEHRRPQAHGGSERHAQVFKHHARRKDERINTRADEPVDEQRCNVVRRKVRALHQPRDAAGNAERHGKNERPPRSLGMLVAQHEVKRKQAEARARMPARPALARAEEERKARIRHRAFAPEGRRVPRTDNPCCSLEPPNQKHACPYGCEEIKEPLLRFCKPARRPGRTLRAPGKQRLHEEDERRNGHDDRYGFQVLVEKIRQDDVIVKRPAAAVEKRL